MSQYPIVKFRPKIQFNLLNEYLDKKAVGKFLFVGTFFALLFCCIYLPFKGIRYNSNTNSVDGRGVISVLESKKEPMDATSKIKETVATAPKTKETKPIDPTPVDDVKASSFIPIIPINRSFWPKMHLPDLISPISNSFNQIIQGMSKVETKPVKTTKILDVTTSNNTGLGPSNLSIDPFATNAPKIQAVSGRVIWQDGANYTVKSDKFLIRSSLSIQVGDKEQVLTVDNSGLLPADTLLSVNKDTFIKLGGNPSNQSYIDAVVKTR